jgi:hypothetical protein
MWKLPGKTQLLESCNCCKLLLSIVAMLDPIKYEKKRWNEGKFKNEDRKLKQV